MSNSKQHIEQRIQDYLDGKLTSDEADALWAEFLENPDLFEHLKINAQLQNLFKEKRGEISKSDSNDEESATIHTLNFYERNKKWVLALAAVILITIGLNLLQTDHHPMMVSAIDDISLLDMETVDVTRSEAAQLTGADSLLFFAYDAAVRNNDDLAMDLYERVSDRFPQSLESAKAKLNLGILAYNRRDYDEAESYFLTGLDIPHDDYLVLEKTHWFLANTYTNRGELELARQEVMVVFNMNGNFRDAAYQKLRQLNISLGNWEME